MKNSFIVGALILLGSMFSILSLSTCKGPEPPKAIITVIDSVGIKIAGATVTVYCEPLGCIVEKTQITNSVGAANFDFDLPAVLKILATKDDLVGVGEIKLVEDETTYETVTIN